jgi:hypothetical protein
VCLSDEQARRRTLKRRGRSPIHLNRRTASRRAAPSGCISWSCAR